ncbi:gamma-aminobutyric acid receptor subunit beta-like [Convolutriloba macropyga]|uniref:gamma-aminobutyric acid receptor subunit beta-like n=1 Tax=Convolutriloba macropyga TaxID=536237 RepID=UPI003F5286E2
MVTPAPRVNPSRPLEATPRGNSSPSEDSTSFDLSLSFFSSIMAVTARKPILETVYQAEPADEEQEEQSGFYQEPAQQEQNSVQYGASNYTILSASFQFDRLYSVYIYQIIIPSAILVIISWTVFWININVTPARVGIGVTAILTLLTLSTNRKQDADSKYLLLRTSLLDIYIWSCFLFVIFAYLEVSMSDYMITGTPKKISLGKSMDKKVTGKMLTTKSRIVFPLLFFLFNCIFWSYVYSF